jgi:hypothetical protein
VRGYYLLYIILSVFNPDTFQEPFFSVFLSDILLNEKCYEAAILMVEEKQVPFPHSISRGIFTLIAVAGVILFITWTIAMFIKSGRILDWGIYAVSIILVLIGIFGRLVHTVDRKQDS